MWLFEFGQLQPMPEEQNGQSAHNQDQHKQQVVEVFSYHIEGFVRSSADQEVIYSETEHEEGWLHICGAEAKTV